MESGEQLWSREQTGEGGLSEGRRCTEGGEQLWSRAGSTQKGEGGLYEGRRCTKGGGGSGGG